MWAGVGAGICEGCSRHIPGGLRHLATRPRPLRAQRMSGSAPLAHRSRSAANRAASAVCAASPPTGTRAAPAIAATSASRSSTAGHGRWSCQHVPAASAVSRNSTPRAESCCIARTGSQFASAAPLVSSSGRRCRAWAGSLRSAEQLQCASSGARTSSAPSRSLSSRYYCGPEAEHTHIVQDNRPGDIQSY